MTSPLSRESRKAETRRALIDAATRLFAERGIASTPLDEVARSVGLTKGAVYGQFASKNELIHAILDSVDQAAGLGEHRDLLFDSSKTLEQRLRDLGRSMARLLRHVPPDVAYLDAELFLYTARDPAAHEFGAGERRVLRELGARLERVARERGETLPMPGVRFVTLVQTLARGILYQVARDRSSLPDEVIEAAFSALAHVQ